MGDSRLLSVAVFFSREVNYGHPLLGGLVYYKIGVTVYCDMKVSRITTQW